MKRKVNGIIGLLLLGIAGFLVMYVALASTFQQFRSDYQLNELRITIKFWKELIAVCILLPLGTYFRQKS
jgi:uncharacterized membrane-anchored protein